MSCLRRPRPFRPFFPPSPFARSPPGRCSSRWSPPSSCISWAPSRSFSVFEGTFIHELTHDARHVLGFPCH
ncbi:CbtB domain-containing protein [Micromonospora sp. BRA006-A]|nr:CbtB domain-containing protein [Micromonospora sp. BRA006-A]